MKRAATILFVFSLALSAIAQSQSDSSSPPPIPDNPDSLFGPSTGTSSTGGTGSSSSTGDNSASQATTQSPDSMFQGGMVQSLPSSAAEKNTNPAQSLLTNQGIHFGGSLESTYTAYGYWKTQYPDLSNIWQGFTDQLVPDLKGTLYFDARPDPNFRVFGKLYATYPFQNTTDITYLDSTQTAQNLHIAIPNINLFELYSDFNYKNTVYFRVGKQVVNWGVGYFFSPADVISLAPIDPQNPTIEREGPVALKTNIPFAEVDNLYLYLIANQAFASRGTFRVNDVAVAPKAEFVIGGYEIGVGGYYQRNQRPKAMLTATGSIGKIGVFGEAVLSKGADKTLVRAVSAGSQSYETYTDTTSPYFSGTVGFNYTQPDWHVTLYGQYYYNGQGYADSNLVNQAYNLYAAQQLGIPHTGPDLVPQDLQQPGRNYGAAVANWSNINDSNVTLSVFWEGNFSDGSGVVSPSVSYAPFDHMTLTAATHVSYGADNTEFVRTGRMSVSIGASLGAGNF